jgi:ubiquinone/menaquinone biosynthesis C-methylase UbiE
MKSKADSGYLMESPEEGARLEMKTDAAVTERLLSLAGLRAGMNALDAGAGTGAVARVMSRVVGPRGSVVAADRSPQRLEQGRSLADAEQLRNLSFVQADLEHAPVPREGTYDFIWCRFVFEYLTDPDAALANLVRSAKPGGKVVVIDLDSNGTIHFPIVEDVEVGLEHVLRALEGRFDPHAGRKLYSRFRRSGLADILVHLEPYNVYAGAAPPEALANWSEKLRVIRPHAMRGFASEAAFDLWASRFLGSLRDPEVFTYSVLVVVEGVRAP